MANKKKPWGEVSIPIPDEVIFYRDVVCRKPSNLIANSKITQEALNHNIKLVFHPSSKNISTNIKEGVIELTSFEENNNPNSFALNRHLRNAFCHLNIIVEGENCLLRDFIKILPNNKIQTTMSGKVNYEDLKELIKSMLK